MASADPPFGSVAILGLGLIGGSLARDLAARGVRVLVWDRDPAAVDLAVGQRIAEPLSDDAPEIVVLAVPVMAACELLDELRDELHGARLVTDVGSTKGSIVALAEKVGIGDRFVGSHPIAGDHRSGWAASRAGLFAGARVFLSPAPSATEEAVGLAERLWRMVDARPEMLDAEEHDRRLAWSSHLPQLMASALGGALADAGVDRAELGPGGRDVTRLAGSSPEMWADIGIDNAGHLAPALAAAEARLRELRLALEAGDGARLRQLLAEARDWQGSS
ncbi:prephenate dehydrogenase/arogenate dehydrogenase family protein [Longimicrobium terrae]|uniref:Prephenate dehydrogenase n=1 Tax=Longimicrobium terrae TaxID=1639882 RepID=A0A841GWT4_9BACT|nr:prephenate dehydrogenase [Longimicrobium terrae]MBB6069765.1 prephenate dehydrogenase [Longimicrobium terrae]NNC31024.1 prephenate dehydrogenase/arogenate dehydrogenase family protein [Longimicrobium terrae]